MFLKNKATGEVHAVSQHIFTAGSGTMSDLVLRGEHVRKTHFQILRGGGEFHLIALNGTVTVNGRAVAEHTFSHGDELRAGKDVFRAEFAGGPDGWEAAVAAAPVESAAERFYETLAEGVAGILENSGRRKFPEQLLALGVELMQADGGRVFVVKAGEAVPWFPVSGRGRDFAAAALQAALKNGETLIWSASGPDAHSAVVTPLAVRPGGEVSGLLYLFRRRPRPAFTEGERKRFAKAGRVLGAALAGGQLAPDRGVGDPVYVCAEMARTVAAAQRAASGDMPVLLLGEAGTGKRTLAEFIHARSPRAAGPFLAVRCGGLPAQLVESEIFGHEKGAFAGAAARQRGAFEQAAGGTLFLQDVEKLSLPAQAKLSRALETGRLRRMGAEEEIPVEARVLAASERPPEEEMRAGRMREDLYYRLGAARLSLLPLREREGDLPALAARLLADASAAFNMNSATLTRAAEKAMLKYAWPGNARELKERLQRALLHSGSRALSPADLDLPGKPAASEGSLKAARAEAERRAVARALAQAEGNLSLAAELLGIDRKVLRDVMTRLQLRGE